MFIDPLYIIISLPAIILGLFATFYLRRSYNKYKNTANPMNINGTEAVAKIAERYNFDIDLNFGQEMLSDHYNPLNKSVSLSPEVAKLPTIASVGIAAHEMGHVEQHQRGFLLIHIRTLIAPVVNVGSTLGYILFFIGFGLASQSQNSFGVLVVWLGVALFAGTTIFSLITLPIEIDASRRAIRMIRELHLVDDANISGVKSVLTAAALTYVAATTQSVLNLLYFVLQARGLSSRD